MRAERRGRSILGFLVFLVVFSLGLVAVLHWVIAPALRASAGAGEEEKRKLGATAYLVMVVLLFALVSGLVLTFRFGRVLLRPGVVRGKTQYTDAWAEAGKRMEAPKEEE